MISKSCNRCSKPFVHHCEVVAMIKTCWIQHSDGIEQRYPFDRFEAGQMALRLFVGARLVAQVSYQDIAAWVFEGGSKSGQPGTAGNGSFGG